MVSPARRAALLALRSVHGGGADLAAALERTRAGLDDVRDRALASELTHGVLRWRASLDYVIAWAGHRDLAAFDPVVLDILRIGTYQLLHLTRVPASAAVHDAVEQCREWRVPRAVPAVNAILRAVSRGHRTLPLPAADAPLAFLSVTLSHPAWLSARWIDRMGATRSIAWASFNNSPAPLVLRAHAWVESRESLAAWLLEQGVATVPTRYAPDGLVVTSGNPITATAGVGSRFAIQDESSQLVAAFVGVRPGERLLDTCAAPGGKTTAMLGTGGSPAGTRVVACDLRPRRVRLLRQTLAMAAAPGVHVARADATAPLPFGPVFDAVLVDAPCSGLGTIRRDPDIRWRRREDDLQGYAETQLRMLRHAAAAVRRGGRLIYATCSSEPDENVDVVARFVAESGWRSGLDETDRAALPPIVRECLDEAGSLAPAPDRHGLEPFFACCLRAPP